MITKEFVFNTDVELVKGMKELGMVYEDILYTLKHEKPHLDKARELGYEAKYRIKFEIENDGLEVVVAYSGHVDINCNGKDINPKHLREIALATPNPSHRDLLISEFAEEILKK